MSYTEAQRERSEAYEARKQRGAFFPLDDLLAAMARRRIDDEAVIELAENIKNGSVPELAQWVQSDSRGKKYLRLPDFVRSNEGQAIFESVPGLRELIHELDRDLTLSGKRSYEIREFQLKREGIAKEVREETVHYAERAIDFEMELVGEFTDRSFETPELAHAFETVQALAQSIVDRLFAAANLPHFRPVVRLTRSSQQNAFVLYTSAGQLREFLASGTGSTEPIELPVYIHYGMFEKFQTEDEIADVLGHEISHLFQPEFLSAQDDKQRQRLEYDADAMGMRMVDAAGYNPRSSIELMRRMGNDYTNVIDRTVATSHPATANRITELEKLFHNPDLPLPNAAKAFTKYSDAVTEAIAFISKKKREYRYEIISHSVFEDDGTLDKRLRDSPKEVFLSSNMVRYIGQFAETRRVEPATTQELAHDTLGRRTAVLGAMKAFLLSFRLKDSADVEYSRSLYIDDYIVNGQIPMTDPETALSVPNEHEQYMHADSNPTESKENTQKFTLPKRIAELIGTDAENVRADTLEDWLDESNADVQPFWDFVSEHVKVFKDNGVKRISRQYRLGIIRMILMETLRLNTYNSNILWVSKIVTQRWEEKVQKPNPKKSGESAEAPSRLQSVGARLRAHQKVEQKKEEEPEYEMVQRERKDKEDLLLLKQTSGALPELPAYWEGEIDAMPTVCRDLIALQREGYKQALQKLFAHEMGEPVDNAVIEYLFKKIHFDDSSGYSREFKSAYKDGLLGGINPENYTISFFDKVVKVLSSKSLAHVSGLNKVDGQDGQWKLRRELAALIAFGLQPQNPDEEAVQRVYLRRMELDHGLAGKGKLDNVFLLGGINFTIHDDVNNQTVNEGDTDLSRFNWRYARDVKKDYKVPAQVYLNVESVERDAFAERMWHEYGKVFESYIAHGGPLERSNIPQFAMPEVRAQDKDIARMVIEGVFRMERMNLKKIGHPDAIGTLADRLAHIASGLRGYIDLGYSEGALTTDQLWANMNAEINLQQTVYGVESKAEEAVWPFLQTAIESAARTLEEEFGQMFGSKFSEVARKLVVYSMVHTNTVGDVFKKALHISSLHVGSKPSREFERTSILVASSAGSRFLNGELYAKDTVGAVDWYAYHPHDSTADEVGRSLSGQNSIRFEDVEAHLRVRAREHPAAEMLIEELQFWKDAESQLPQYAFSGSTLSKFVNKLKVLALGNLVYFENPAFGLHIKGQDERIRRFWRLAAEIYHDEWKDIEQIKRLDEQLAHWEWEDRENNPVVRSGFYQDKKSIETKVRRPCKILDKPLARYLRGQFGRDLGNVYKVDTRHLNEVSFSWPLFMQDVWDGADIAEKLHLENQSDETPKHENRRALFNLLVAELKADIEGAAADPNNLPDIEAMEPGFFKEFIINEKMKRAGVSSLEEIEVWLPHLEQRSHEGSERNQIFALLENERFQIADKRKKAIAEDIIKDMGYGWLLFHKMVKIQTSGFGLHINEEEVRLKLQKEQHGWVIYDRDENGAIITEKQHDGSVMHFTSEKPPHTHEEILNVFLPAFYARYQEAIGQEIAQGRNDHMAAESDILVFSDHVVEHEKSRLEIGPAYRLRWVSQPLMNWHSEALEQAEAGKDVEHLFERVENALPDAHPLRDVFAFNQLAVELWSMIESGMDTSVLVETGATLVHTYIDLKTVLKEYPLYHDISFLKAYRRYRIDGFAGLARRMGPQFADQIIAKMEHYYNDVMSEEGKMTLRKMMMEIEKVAVWPNLREDRKKDPDVFGAYINRIERLYPESTFERDDILESIGMELAHTPEEIKRVWSLRYAEMVRWPEQEEQKSVGRQFDAFEKLKMGVSTLGEDQRAAYVLWFMGGPTPLSESLVAAQKAISLDNRKELFWSMSAIERRHLLYEICTQDNGIFENRRGSAGYDSSHPWKEWGASEDMIDYVSSELFELTFGENLLDVEKEPWDETNVRGREALKIIFQGLFRHQKDSARRTELLANIAEAMGDARKENRELDTGELMVLLLEQAGVIGIKAGQVLSEIPGFLPDNIRQSLGDLKDRASEFSKRGVLAYLEAGGWLRGEDKKLLELKHTEAAASIKQVNRLEIELDGKRHEAVAKAKRPSIDKNFTDDVRVLGSIITNLQLNRFRVPDYLLPEVETVVREELDFLHEVENQRALGASLGARKAQMDVWFGDEQSAVPLTVSAPLGVGEVHYPNPEIDVDIGLIVEEYVTGLSLKDLQRYKRGSESNDAQIIEEMHKKITDKYGSSRVKEIEKKIQTIDLDHFQAELGLELLRQIVRGGAFHADLHSGNFFLDFTPSAGEGELHEARGIFLDTGAMGFSLYQAMPEYLQKDAKSAVDNRDAFRSFLSALFAPNMKYDIIGQIVHRFTGLNWNAEYLAELVGTEAETGGKVKKIFYSVLEQAGKNLDQQFRYFLKAVATGADHLDKLKTQIASELASRGAQNRVMKKLAQEQLLDFKVIM